MFSKVPVCVSFDFAIMLECYVTNRPRCYFRLFQIHILKGVVCKNWLLLAS